MRILAIGDFQGVFSVKLQKKIAKEDFDLVIGIGDYTGIKEWYPLIMKQLNAAKKGEEVPTAEEYFGKKRFKQLRMKDYKAGKTILKGINKLKRPALIIFGNTDWYHYPFERNFSDEFSRKRHYDDFIKKLRNLKNLNYRKRKFKGINFVGFGGYMDIDAYFDKKQWKNSEDKKSMQNKINRRERGKKKLNVLLKNLKGDKILVFHYPPKGVFDIIKGKKNNPMNGKSAGIRSFSDAIKKYKPRLVLCGHMHEYQGMKKLHGVSVINPGDAEKGKCAVVDFPEDGKKKIKVRFIK